MGMQGTPFTDQVVAAVDALTCGCFEKKHPMDSTYIRLMRESELYYNDDNECNFYWSPKVISIEERHHDNKPITRQHSRYY